MIRSRGITRHLSIPSCGGIQTYHPDGTIKSVDSRCLACWQKEECDFIGKNWMEFLSSQTTLENAKEFMKLIQKNKTATLGIRSFQHPTKGPMLHRTIAVPTFDENGEITEITVWDEPMYERRKTPR